MIRLRRVPPVAWFMLGVGAFTLVACSWLILLAAEHGFTPV